MTDKQLKRLSRKELFEVMKAQAQRIEELEAEVQHLQSRLDDRSITISNAGTLAEACLALNQVFEAAQAAADQYLENVKSRDVPTAWREL